VQEIWRRKAFCALGDGDIDVEQVLAALDETGYAGWLVVEQDVLPDPENPTQPAEDQRRNREYLRGHGL
jgi:inosose dehydratase